MKLDAQELMRRFVDDFRYHFDGIGEMIDDHEKARVVAALHEGKAAEPTPKILLDVRKSLADLAALLGKCRTEGVVDDSEVHGCILCADTPARRRARAETGQTKA